MKKTYVRVKREKPKALFRRPYIAATVIGAVCFAVLLSVSAGRGGNAKKQAPQKQTERFAEATPSVSSFDAISEPKIKKEEPTAVTPTTKPTEKTIPDNTDVPQPATEDVGLFSADREFRALRPVDGEIQKEYSSGKPMKSKTLGDWRMHNGVDIAAPVGTQVRCCADGTVVSAEENSLTGFTVVIDHGNNVVSTTYNLEKNDALSAGKRVKGGDVLGKSCDGAAIELLDEPHVHFELTVGGEYVNPLSYFDS